VPRKKYTEMQNKTPLSRGFVRSYRFFAFFAFFFGAAAFFFIIFFFAAMVCCVENVIKLFRNKNYFSRYLRSTSELIFDRNFGSQKLITIIIRREYICKCFGKRK
jgi:hypothetical protein